MAKMMMGVAYSVTGRLTLKIVSLLRELTIVCYCNGSSIDSSTLVATRRSAAGQVVTCMHGTLMRLGVHGQPIDVSIGYIYYSDQQHALRLLVYRLPQKTQQAGCLSLCCR